MSNQLRDIIALAFGEKQIQPSFVPQVPQLARLISQVTPANVMLRAVEGSPTLGEELRHLLSTLENYIEHCAPGAIEKHDWAKTIIEGKAYEAFEDLRRQVDRAINSM
ncbi:MAG: hypothetical protein KDB07_13340, partial [Planctomycetes bacterium]|nr:hypothetical protein [Planctomycetota bacterium]